VKKKFNGVTVLTCVPAGHIQYRNGTVTHE